MLRFRQLTDAFGSFLLLAVLALGSLAVAWGQRIPATHIVVGPRGASAGETGFIEFYELSANGENFISWKAADSMAVDTPYVWPNAYPASSGDVLSSTTAGVTSWIPPPGGPPTGPAGGSLSGTYPNPALAATQPDAHTWSGVQTFAGSATIFSHASGGNLLSDTTDGSDSKLNTVNGGGGGGITRGGGFTSYGNEHANGGWVLIQPGNVTGGAVTINSRTGVFQARFLDRNFLLGNSGDTFPTGCLNCLILGTAAAPSANPVTGNALFNDAGFGYRSSTAGEGQGVTNRVHNRFEEQAAIGTAYTFTTVGAKVAFGTTSPEVTLSTAGTWLLIARLTIEYSAATTTGQAVAVRMRNVTDSIDIANTTISHRLGTHTVITDSVFSNSWTGIYTIALASRNIQIFGNLSGAIGAGTIIAVAGEMRAVRLY